MNLPTTVAGLVLCLSLWKAGNCAPVRTASPGDLRKATSAFYTAPTTESPKRRLFFVQMINDLSYLSGQPDFHAVVGGLSIIPGLFPRAIERETPLFTEIWGSSTFADNLFEVGEIVGDGAFPVGVAATLWSAGKTFGAPSLANFGTDLFRVQAANGFLTTVFKRGINRTRPDGTPYSYPSGHTSSAFATAGAVYTHFGKTWGIGAFAIAGYVGLSRLQEGKHYLSDVIAGGLLGTYISLKLARRSDRRTSPVSILPSTIEGHPAIKFSVRL